ncbi:NUDIX hydrolase [Streptomyces tropicalis]|uniref:NUDIX domain-containing protein n=1 Tax=Streptomyces tropicalis TaxID=3034234 RepID=A0ABT6A6E6_9ACTN|nr:NUDIX domain-containing protein [Streptomyces tropicalis]MDF3300224.1 NUDIX domain-containing protein [Streptomyces tropicalis]
MDEWADEWVERVDEHDRVRAVVRRDEAVRHGWLHRVAVTLCTDGGERILVHRRSERVARFPGCYEAVLGGAVAVGESYEQAAERELAEELGVAVPVRFVLKFLNRAGLSPHWLGVHEAVVVPVEVRPDPGEVMWHDWLTAVELARFMRQHPFTPDSGAALGRYREAVRRRPIC